MELLLEKCVIIVDEALPLGIIANTAAVLGISLGKALPQAVGDDVVSKSGGRHSGVIQIPVPILKAAGDKLNELRQKLSEAEFSDCFTVDFTDLAQSCKTYPEFIDKMGQTPEPELRYLGLAICGAKKKVNRLTGNLPLLR